MIFGIMKQYKMIMEQLLTKRGIHYKYKSSNVVLMVVAIMMSLVFIQCKESVTDKFIKAQVEEVNRQCPMKMGNGLTMERCEAAENKTLKYYISMSKSAAQQITFDDATKASMVASLKALPQFKQMKELGISYHYIYSDEDKNEVGEFKISPEDYN